MERGEGKMPAVEPNVLCTVSRSDTRTPQDALQGLERDRNLNSLIREGSEELSGAEKTMTDLLYQSGSIKRSARASSNLRKSLAWDKAFSTDEGVLDVDELPLVTKTPRKPLELHPLDIPGILGKVSPAPLAVLEKYNPNARAANCGEMITSSGVQSSRHLECLPSGSPNSPTFETASSKDGSLVVAHCNLDTTTSKLDSKSSVSVSEVVKADALKATRLRLPSTFTGKRGKSDIRPKPVSVAQSSFLRRCKSSSSILSPSSASSTFSKKVSSVSKKVKDTLGKVLPGSLGGSARHSRVNEDRPLHQGQAAKASQTPMGHRYDATGDDVNSTGPASVAKSISSRASVAGNFLDANMTSKKKDAKVGTNNQEVIPTDQMGNGTVVPGLAGSSTGKDAGPSSKKGSDNPPMISRKKLGPEGSQSPLVENSLNAAQSSKGLSSGLRLPSPKIGFFDTPRSASGDHPSTFPERVFGSASDTSNWKSLRKGLPPRPHHGLPSGHAEKPGFDGSRLAKVATKVASSGIPSAPHLRPFGKPVEGLVRPASGPTSPHRHHHGILLSASHQAVIGRRSSSQTNSDQFHSSVTELRPRTLRNGAPGTFQDTILESSDCESGQSLNPMGPVEVGAQPLVIPSKCSSTGYRHDVKFGNLGGDKSPSKLANLSVASTSAPTEKSLSGSLQLAGLMDKSSTYCRLSSVVEDIRGANENVFCREKGTINNVIGELTISSSIEPLVDSVCYELPPAKLDGSFCPEFDSVSSAQTASAPEFESCLGREILDKYVGHDAGDNPLGCWEDNPRMANLDLGRSLGNDSRLKNDHELQDSSKFSKVESSVDDVMSCCATGKLTVEDSPKATTSGYKELSRTIPKIEARKIMPSGKLATEERARGLTSISPARLPESECTKRNNDSSLNSPSTWSDWSFLAATNRLPSQPSLGHTPTITTTSEKLSYTRTITAENTHKNTPESFLRSSSLASASDGQCSKHPLAVNAGLMNGISKRTSLTASRKERNFQNVFEQSASETTFGQENKRGSDGQIGATQLHKPKQRKSNSSHRLDQPEAYGDLFSEERLRALEAAGQESLLKKSGAVQHSPPNKTSPNRNPWSPVKKGGQQPGPFDCTKKYTNACTGQ